MIYNVSHVVIAIIIDFLCLCFAGFITSPYFSPINDRMRKRRAFADQDLMETTITNYYLGYQQMHMTPPTTYPAMNYNIDEQKQIKLETETEATTRPKISFSIESIIGIK